MIYFIKAGNYIKVGYSKSESSFKYRMSSYKTSCPFEVEVISKIEGGVEEERNILSYFIEFHTRGEWFNYNESIVVFALNPYELPKSKFLKPLFEGNKIINDNLEEMLELYKQGVSLRLISEQFKVGRSRIIKYIPEEMKRGKNEWSRLRRREINPKNIPIVCTTTGDTYISSAEASRVLNVPVSGIWKVLKGQRKQTKGLIFEYLEKEL